MGLIILAGGGVVQILTEKRDQFVPDEPQNEKADLMLFRTKSAFVGRLTGKFDWASSLGWKYQPTNRQNQPISSSCPSCRLLLPS